MYDQPLVRFENLRVDFQTKGGAVHAVKGVSFDVQAGETLAIVGESGSGKSVSSLSLMRLVEFGGGTITGGKLLFERAGQLEDLAQETTANIQAVRGREIGMIFQEPMTALNPVFTIGRQLTEGLRKHMRMDKQQAQTRALELMQLVRIPEPERRLTQYPHELSGGMRQRVVIAMALACEPKLLIADEPTTALDVTIQAEILALMNRLKDETGTAVMFITHDMAVVAQMADRVVVMYKGEKVEEGPVEQIFANPQHDYTKNLLAAVPRLGDMQGKDQPEPLRILGDKRAEEFQAAAVSDQVVLSIKNLTTRFPVKGGFFRRTVSLVHALEDVTFDIHAGETLSLVGESGSGKSTCGRSIMRLVEPTSGQITLDGQDLLGLNEKEMRLARQHVQMIFQDPFASLNPQMTLADQVAEPLQNFAMGNRQERFERVAALFDRVELPRNFMQRYPHELSGGQRQRVAIARALALQPKLLIADEAVSALDVSVQAQVLNLLLELQAELGISMLFISHDMAVVERVSHRVAVMYLGRIVEMGSRKDVFENPQHPYTKTLLAAVPVADPKQRKLESDFKSRLIPSPIHPVGYEPEPVKYEEVSPKHWILLGDHKR